MMREVFANVNFRKLFFANLFSGFGQGMSMIGISWYLVQTTGSAALLGSTMFVSAIVMFLISPYFGTLIDRFSRKNVLLIENLVGFSILALLAVWGLFGSYADWMLITIYMITTLIFQVHYPAQSALVQEGFEPKYYNDINSLLEIESQTSSMLAGGIAGMILSKYGLHVVLFFNALTYLFSFVLLSTMAYTFTLQKQANSSRGISWIAQLGHSWQFIRVRPGFLLFGISALMPFVAVMAGNLVAPVFVDQTLKGDVMVFSLGDMTYAVGAVAAGFLIMRCTARWGAVASMVGNTLLFAATLVGIVTLPVGWVFIGLNTLIGWCNASTRLVRQSIYMTIIPNQLMGRVLSFMNSAGMLMRLVLIGTFTVSLDTTGAGAAYLVLAALLVLAGVGVAVSLRKLNTASAAIESRSGAL